MLLKYIFSVQLLVGLVFGAGKDLESLINDVFKTNKTNPTTVTTSTTQRIDLQPNSGGGGGGTQTNDDCVCVPYYLCNNGTVNTNGENIIDIR